MNAAEAEQIGARDGETLASVFIPSIDRAHGRVPSDEFEAVVKVLMSDLRRSCHELAVAGATQVALDVYIDAAVKTLENKLLGAVAKFIPAETKH
ncbi:hypothetical protein [Terrarubrum flagellatum]|uniref:hypothetical protein n=1 Tax=Terrirubrum flagellatum TaxID=2895980 RepID=UPI0031453314